MALVFELWLGNRRSRGRGVLGIRLFRNRVNKRLKTALDPLRMGVGRQSGGMEPGWNRAGTGLEPASQLAVVALS